MSLTWEPVFPVDELGEVADCGPLYLRVDEMPGGGEARWSVFHAGRVPFGLAPTREAAVAAAVAAAREWADRVRREVFAATEGA